VTSCRGRKRWSFCSAASSFQRSQPSADISAEVEDLQPLWRLWLRGRLSRPCHVDASCSRGANETSAVLCRSRLSSEGRIAPHGRSKGNGHDRLARRSADLLEVRLVRIG
jgi:hypothetical protein